MMLASQLSSDDFINLWQALVIHNSFDIFIAIKLILGWVVFFLSASLEFSKEMTCILQIKTWCKGTLVIVGKRFEYPAQRSSSPLWKPWQSISSSISFALLVINSKVIMRKLFLVPAKRAQKTVRALIEAWVLCIQLTEDWYFGNLFSELMNFKTFQAFEVF